MWLLRTLALSLIGAAACVGRASSTPNILVVIADDCTYSDLECYGGQAKTPHLNQLCSQGMRFTRCFQAAPMCSPTRHCLYTGIYPVKSGAYPNHTFVKAGTRSIAHYLSRVGYRVALSGKTHINPRAAFPFEYSGRRNPDLQAVDKLFAECKAAETPFCLFACSNEPHTPWDKGDASVYPPESLTLPPFFVDTPGTRAAFSRYLAEVSYFDNQVGLLLQLLQRHKLDQNTLVIVLSEQGNSFPHAKWTCYDPGLQSGMVVRWPGEVEAGAVSDAMVEYVDLVPTLLAATRAPEPYGLDGRSFLGVLNGQSATHKQYAFGLQTTRGINNGSEGFAIRTVRDERYRYIVNLQSDVAFSNVAQQSAWWQEWVALAGQGSEHAQRMVDQYQRRPAEELFDTQQDPLNQRNLADSPQLSEVKSRLRSELLGWMQQQGDQGVETEMRAKRRQWRHRQRGK